jgi:hypothetical protein
VRTEKESTTGRACSTPVSRLYSACRKSTGLLLLLLLLLEEEEDALARPRQGRRLLETTT